MKLFKLIVLASLLIVPSVGKANSVEQSPKLVKGKLPNGITYYIYQNDFPKGEAVYRLFLKTGALYEKDSQRGLAHFLEHMAFNGMTGFPGDGIIKYLTGKGAKFGRDVNAHTSVNETVYKLKLQSTDLGVVDTTLMILSGWAHGLSLDSLQIEKERDVIMSEWLARKGPEEEASNALLSDLLNGSHYTKRMTIGDTAVIKNFRHKELSDYYDAWYHPSLMAIAVAGDVNVPETERMIKERFGSISSGFALKIKDYPVKNFDKPKATVMVNDAFKDAAFTLMELRDMPEGVKDEKSYRGHLFRTVLNRLISNRFAALAFKDPAYKKSSILLSQIMNVKGVWYGTADLFPARIEEGIEAYAYALEQIYRYGFTADEIARVKKVLSGSLEKEAVNPSPVNSMSYMDQIYSDFYRGSMILSPKEEYRLYRKYSGDIDSLSVLKMIKGIHNPAKTHYMLTAFDSTKNKIPSEKEILAIFDKAAKQSVEPYKSDIFIPESLISKMPEAGSYASEGSIPEIEAGSYTLSNGARVIFKRTGNSKKSIGIRGFRDGGLYAVDSADYVSGQFAAEIIPASGAGDFTRDALTHYLAGNSANVRFMIDRMRSGVTAVADTTDMETMFQLLYLKWTEPRMDTALYSQMKNREIEKFRTENKTESDIFTRDFIYLTQGEDYTRRELSDTVIMNELKPERMLPVFEKCFGPASGYTFIITGDCDYSYIEPYVLQYIAALPSGNPDTAYVYGGAKIPHKAVSLVRNGGDSPKTMVNMVFLQDTISTGYRDFSLKGDIAKGIIRTKLLSRLREKMGMIYSVRVQKGMTPTPTLLARESIEFPCEVANVDTLIAATFDELDKIVKNPASIAVELSDVKSSLIKDNEAKRQEEAYWSNEIRNVISNGNGDWSYVTDYNEKVNAVTAEEIAAYIKEAFFDTPMVKGVLYPKSNTVE